jgi:Spy/CpxP family protein refolding chaperone
VPKWIFNEVSMKKIFKKRIWSLPLLVLGLAFIGPSSVLAQQMAGTPQQPHEANAQPPGALQDPIAQLNLSPEQRQKIRAIREQSKDERALINRRLRETQVALDQALDADNPNEALIEQRAREAGEAQVASIRLRALTETRIRRVLTPEQLNTLRQLRAQAQQLRKEQRLDDRANDVRGRGVNGRPLPNQRNGILPGRRDNLLRRPRP